MSASTPTARGTLAERPLLTLLTYVLSKELTGTLVFESEHGRSAILFEEGAPSKAKLAEPTLQLATILMDFGVLGRERAERTLSQAARERRLHGEVLVELAVTDEETVEDALREQVARKVLHLFDLPGTTAFGYFDKVDYLQAWGGVSTPISPLALVARAVEERVPPAKLDGALARLQGALLRFHPEAQPGLFNFQARAKGVVDLLRIKPFSLEQLLEAGAAPPETVKQVVYTLALTYHLNLGNGTFPLGVPRPEGQVDAPPRFLTPQPMAAPASAAPGPRASQPAPAGASPAGRGATPAPEGAAPAAPAPTPTPRPVATIASRPPPGPVPANASIPPPAPTKEYAPEVAARREELKKRVAALEEATLYDVLEIDSKVKGAQIQAAFFKAAKAWHPDRLGPDFADLKSQASKLFSKINEARETLSDAKKREAYDQALASGHKNVDEEQAKVAEVLGAAHAHQMAEVLLKSRKLKEAEAEAKKAATGDPEQPEYLALYCYVQSLNRAAGPYDDLLSKLDQTVDKEPDNVRIRNYRAQVLKKAGREDDAIDDFRLVVEADPHNVDALREVRLWEKRGRTKSGEAAKDKGASTSGLFGGLFGKR